MKQKLLLFLLFLMGIAQGAMAQKQAYATLSDDGQTVTFYYDDQKASRSGVVEINNKYLDEDTDNETNVYGTTTTAVFDASFADYRPTSTAYWFMKCSELTSIIGIKYLKTEDVTDMRYMFSLCSKLTSIDLSNFNTSNVKYMNYMFYGCSALTSLDLSNFNTSNMTNMSWMFCSCTGLTTLDLSNFNTENVTNMSNMFRDCSSLTSLDLSNFNTGNVRIMSSMFYNSSSLTNLDLSNFDTSNVTEMGAMFYGCTSLTSLDLSNFNTSNVKYMDGMFTNCSSLTNLDLSNFNTSKVTDMAVMFHGCSNLTILGLSNFNTENVTDMGGMFTKCSRLTSIDVSNFITSNVKYMSSMFYGCSSLTSLDLSNFNTGNVTTMGSMFSGCSSLTSIDLSNFITSKVTNMNYMFYGCSNLTTIYASNEWSTEKVTDGSYMFLACTSLVGGNGTKYDTNHRDHEYARIDKEGQPGYLTYKNAPIKKEAYAVLSDDGQTVTFYYDDLKASRSGVVEINNKYLDEDADDETNVYGTTTTAVFDASFADYRPTSTAYWFMKCSELTSIIGIKYLKTEDVTDMSMMFRECSSLTSLDVSSFNTEKVTNMSAMFEVCSSLTSLDVSNFNTSNVTYMDGMFYGCSALTTLDVSNFNTSNVTNMSWMFCSCTGLTTLDLSNFNTSNVTSMSWMFYRSSALTTIYAGNEWSTEKVVWGGSMFIGCTSLVGGNGTMYAVNHTNHEFARIDKEGQHGYLTDKNAPIPKLAYAALSEDGQTVTFYYDDQKASRSDVVKINNEFSGCAYTNATKAIFDASFADYRPICTAYWFDRCDKLTSISGMENLNTKEVTYMVFMFCSCSSLTSIDLSNFDTSNVTDMYYMFQYCSSLTTIYASNEWNTEKVTDGYGMFGSCTSLVGGNGTKFDANHTDHEYARIDKEGQPGYLTLKSETDLDPIETETTVSTEGLGDEDLTNNVIDDIYYNLDGEESGYDENDGSIVIGKTTNMSEITDATPGSDDVKNNFTGIILMVGAGKGTVTVNVKTEGNAQLAVQIGNGTPTIATRNERGDVVVGYDVEEDTYVYIYAVAGSGATARRIATENAVKIYSITVTPGGTGIGNVERTIHDTGHYFTLDGRKLQGVPTKKGVYIVDGRKVAVK